MRLSVKTLPTTLVLLFLLTTSSAQILISNDPITITSASVTSREPITTSKASSSAAPSVDISTTSRPAPSSTLVLPSSSSVSTLQPSSSSVASSAPVPSATSSAAPSRTSVASSASASLSLPSSTTTERVTSSSSTTSAASSPTQTGTVSDPKPSTTPIIIGSVVGGVVGLALLGGVIACINRRGGCTKRQKKKNDFEDYGLGDFPHQHKANMNDASAGAGMATAGGVTGAAMAMNNKAMSPTVPRLNDQGNYYQDDAYGYNNYGNYYDSSMDYSMQPQQQQGGYYYNPQQEYYDDSNAYYYDNSTSTTAYSPQQPMHHANPIPYSGVAGQHQYNANAHVPQQNVHKPDDASRSPY
ncbi:hypothetical protein BD560DRAFT_383310 [Blakeslea trispora]|nr:hypothetical protein BD560DRAFT_383310 [Blakeslea trispora]